MIQEHIDKGCKLALEEASKSYCKKRKVGAVIISQSGGVCSAGHNYRPGNLPCENSIGETSTAVIHAEIAAIKEGSNYSNCTIFVTHQPCENCQKAIDEVGLKVHLVEQFMKFDTGKLRYSLIPPEATKALASVLTYGAKKYKAKNYLGGSIDRFTDALYRHLEAWRSGQEFDEESGLSHLSHALTNIVIIMELENAM